MKIVLLYVFTFLLTLVDQPQTIMDAFKSGSFGDKDITMVGYAKMHAQIRKNHIVKLTEHTAQNITRRCGATVIGRYQLVTNCHCFNKSIQYLETSVTLGSLVVDGNDGIKIDFSMTQVECHPGYLSKDDKERSACDLAIITLDIPLNNFNIVKLSQSSITANAKAMFISMGDFQNPDDVFYRTQQYHIVQIISSYQNNLRCFSTTGQPGEGNSGMGLFQFDGKGNIVLIGIYTGLVRTHPTDMT
uniref:Peptidase S1 domain-containing protein n=1 Tax=Panagrolaimus davidi TaxID=227884 RepID=A0A914PP84_9BILA